jgi:lysozyme
LIAVDRRSRRHGSPRPALIEPLEGRVLLSRVLGIDISHYQPTTINWTQVKNGNGSTVPGRAFAYAKAVEGTGYNDPAFAGFVSGAHAAGVKIGAYDYARYDLAVDPVAEADHYLSIAFNAANVQLGNGDMVPMLDVEAPWDATDPTTYKSKALVSGWVNAWCNEVKAKTGAVPIVYTYISYATSWLDSSVSNTWPLWMANYNGGDPQTGGPNGTSPWATWQMWQYTDATSVYGLGGTGVTGTCDGDVLNGGSDVLNDYVIGSAGRWADGASVQANTAAAAYSTSASNGTFVTEASGGVGTILQGPVYAASYQRWRVQFKDGKIGWVREDQLNTVTSAPAAVSSPTPTNNASLAASPATLSWADSALATTYDVDVDGVFKANVSGTSYSLATVAAGAHTWQVWEKNSAGSTAGPVWSFTIASANVSPPTQPASVATAGTSVHVSWTASTSSPIDGYRIQRADGVGNLDTFTVAAGATSFDDSGLTPGQFYNYRVQAYRGTTVSIWATAAVVMTFQRGDVNGDYTIDFFDISALLAGKYNTGQPATWAEGDQNGDGVADFFDLTEILGNGYNAGPYWTPPPAQVAAAAVPEARVAAAPSAAVIPPATLPFAVGTPKGLQKSKQAWWLGAA